MLKSILIKTNVNTQKEIEQLVDFKELGYEICGTTDDLEYASSYIMEHNVDIVICEERDIEYIKNNHPKQYKIVLSDEDVYNNKLTYNIKSPITAEKLISRIYAIDFQIAKQKDKLAHRISITEFLLPLILDYKGQYTNEYIEKHIHDSYLIHDYDEPYFCIFSFELLKNKNTLDVHHLYLEEIDNILNKYINAYSYLIGNKVISFFVLSHAGRIKNIYKSVEEIKASFRKKDIDLLVGESSVFNKLTYTHMSYITALESTKSMRKKPNTVRLSIPAEELFKDFEKNLIYIIKNESQEQLDELIDYCFNISKEEKRKEILNTIIETIYKTTLNITGVNQFIRFISQQMFLKSDNIVLDDEFKKREFKKICANARQYIFENRRSDSEGLCDQVIDIINQEYQDENLSLVDISKRLGVSTNYLCSLLKKVTGKNYTSLVNDVRMEAAKSMLMDSNLKINEVASRCGYSDQHYFSTCFKKQYGVSPNKVKNKQIKLPV